MNYTQLQTMIDNWLHRSDLTAMIPDFITLGEAYLNREVIQPVNEATVTTSISDRYAALPTRCTEVVSLVDPYGNSLICRTSKEVKEASVDSVCLPSQYAVTTQFEFDSVSDQAYSLDCFYRKRLDIAADTTNWLLDTYPDCYLYASLVQAMPYIKNDARIQTLAPMLSDSVRGVNSSNRQRPVMRPDYMATQSFDIVRGY